MRQRRLAFALMLLGGGLPQVGCQVFPLTPPSLEGASLGFDKPLAGPRTTADAAEACFLTAEALDKAGRESDAIQGYEMARQKDPRLNQATRRLAVLYDRQGDLSKAAAEYAKALKAFPKDSDLLNDYGYFLYQQERYPEAEKLLRQAMEANPRNQRAAVNLGMAIGQQGRHQDAFSLFSQAVGQAEGHANLGYIYTTQGKREEAIKAYRQALALNGNLKEAQAALEFLSNPLPNKPKDALAATASERPQERSEAPNRPPAFNPGTSKPRDRDEVVGRLSGFRKERELGNANLDKEAGVPAAPAAARDIGLGSPVSAGRDAEGAFTKSLPSVKPIVIRSPSLQSPSQSGSTAAP